MLQEMAKSSNGRSRASDMWYAQIKDQPVSSASVSALQKYLSVFSDGENVTAARSQLEAQQNSSPIQLSVRKRRPAAVDAGQGDKAVAELQKAVSANHADSEAIGAPRTPRKATVLARWHSLKRRSPSIRRAITAANGTAC